MKSFVCYFYAYVKTISDARIRRGTIFVVFAEIFKFVLTAELTTDIADSDEKD